MLRASVKQRLNAATKEIFDQFERKIKAYEEEISRLKENNQRYKLLDAVFNPRVQIHKSGLYISMLFSHFIAIVSVLVTCWRDVVFRQLTVKVKLITNHLISLTKVWNSLRQLKGRSVWLSVACVANFSSWSVSLSVGLQLSVGLCSYQLVCSCQLVYQLVWYLT